MSMGIDLHTLMNLVLLTFLVITALGVIVLKDLLASILLFGIFSLLMALLYLVLEAPDVAITEAAVGAGISTIIFLATLGFTGRKNDSPVRAQFFPLLMVLTVGAALIYSTGGMPHFGAADAPANLHVAPYYIAQTYPDIHIPNIVTAILASYRAFDTLGEVMVVFTALSAVFLLLMPDSRPDDKEGDHDA